MTNAAKSVLARAGLGLAVTLLVGVAPLAAKPAPKSDAAIRQLIINESIASYPGNCPCPYNAARNGSRCGGRSAYSRPGGYAPKCYASDVSTAEVAAYRRARSL